MEKISDLQAAYNDGYAEGHDEGYDEGYAQAERDMQRKTDEEMARHREQIRRLVNGE